MKTRDVSHCVSSLLQKLTMLAPTKKIVKFLEELRMPSLLVQPFPAQMQIYSLVRTYSCTVYETQIRPLARAEVTWVKSRFFCCVRSHYKTPCEVLRSFALWLAAFRAWNLVQLLGNFHPNFAILLTSRVFKPNENGPTCIWSELGTRPILFQPIAFIYTNNMDIRVSKISNRVSKRHPDTPLAKLGLLGNSLFLASPNTDASLL